MGTVPDSPVVDEDGGAVGAVAGGAATSRAGGTPTGRQLPRVSELGELLRFRRPVLDPVQRRLSRSLSIDDLRDVARTTTPRAVFEYVDGAADGEVTARRNRQAFDDLVFVPDTLRSVADPQPSTVLLGQRIALPLVLAPTGYTRMMHQHGEVAVARVARRHGIPYTLSTVGTSTVEDVHRAAPDGINWFQLYLTNDERLNAELVDRAAAAGVTTLVLTVDTAVGGQRLRDVRNGLTIPATLTPRTVLDMARHPAWWFDKLTTPPIGFASVRGFPGTSADVARLLFEPGLSVEHLSWLRRAWPGRVLVKGILAPDDARRVMALGADGVVVSNHGGRQLDRTPATLDVLASVRAAVGPDATVLLDGGVRHGQDVVAARALGADAVMVGRAYLYGLMAGGERGVERAVQILESEYTRSMQLLGVRTTGEIQARHVRAG